MGNHLKKILILGAGFAGIQTARSLEKKLKSHSPYEIILIDERDYHTYTPDLYEIATTFHKKMSQECITIYKEAFAIPYSKIFEKSSVQFLRDRVLAIHPEEKTVELQRKGTLDFEYLVVTLGSVVNYYDIPGLKQFSYPLKTLTDALAIECHLDTHFHSLWKSETKKHVSIVIGGGGPTGVELACELPGYIDKLCKKYGYPREHVEITLIEASANLAGQEDRITKLVLQRFKKFGINAQLRTMIKKVEVNHIEVESAESEKSSLPMDILIWTGGVTPHPLIRESFRKITKNGALPVNIFLQSEYFANIYAAGDNASFLDQKNGKSLPMLAQIAVQQGKIIGENIAADIAGKPKQVYVPHLKGVIIPLGKKFAFLKREKRIYQGWFIWMLRRLVDLGYALSILPFPFAIKKWLHDTSVFLGND